MARALNMFSAVLIFSLVIEGLASILPKEIVRCNLTDPSLDSCLKNSAQKYLPKLLNGFPEIGIPPMDPFSLKDFQNQDPVLNFKFTKNRIFGIQSTNIEQLKINQIKKKITLIYEGSGHMDSHYTVDGRLLIFPIVGEGESVIEMKGIRYTYKMYYEVVKGTDGKDYWKIIKHRVTYTMPTYAHFQFTNLFNGNKELADTLITFTNENWKEIFGVVGPAPMKTITDSVVEELTKFFAKIPVDDLFEV